MQSAISVLDRLGQEFVELRERDRAKAYMRFQRGLMANLGTLSPLIPAKDIVGLSMDIEHYLKGISGSEGKPPMEMMKEFLNSVEKGVAQA